MAILQMRRISICAWKSNRKAILERLQQLGVVEINITLEDDSSYEHMDTAAARAAFEKRAAQAEAALEVLDRYQPENKSFLASLEGKKNQTVSRIREIEAARTQKIETIRKILDLDRKIAEHKSEILRIQTQAEGLTPWLSLQVPLTFPGTQKTAFMVGMMPVGSTRESIMEELAQKAPELEAYELEIISTDKDYVYLTAVCMKSQQTELEENLRMMGFVRPTVSSREIPAKLQEQYRQQITGHQEEIVILEELIGEYGNQREEIRLVADYYRARAEKYRVLAKLPQTQYTFGVSGYVPAGKADAVAKEMEQKFDALVEVSEIPEEEEAPILLKNNGFSDSVESVVESFGLPGKGEFDPTFVTSIFYVFLFGMMLSDAAYGLIMIIGCGIVLKKFPNMAESTRKFLKLFFYCGFSTFFWGVMFGGFFGDAVDVISETFFHHKVSLPAVWFAPLNDPMRLLLFSLAVGLFHMLVGLGLKGYMLCRDGKIWDFVCDIIFWFCLLIGLVLMLVPSDIFAGIAGSKIVLPASVVLLSKILAGGGALGILLTAGRDKKNPGLRLALGAYGLYGITSWLSDALSYSRLLALGLATGVMASVFNQMGAMLGDSIPGVILFILVFIVGHTFNMAINLLGAYVHTSRLQYVEFYGKFYEGGGRAFTPFKQNTKYFDFKEEVKS